MQQVLLSLSQGVPLTLVCRSNNVHRSTIHDWRAQDAAFAQAYDDARQLGFDTLLVECLEIADDRSADLIVGADGVVRPDIDAVRRAKLRIDVRLKLSAKWYSHEYGKTKRVGVDTTAAETRRFVIDPRTLDEAGREALRQLLADAEAQGLIRTVAADE
jgi:hypothetical protein